PRQHRLQTRPRHVRVVETHNHSPLPFRGPPPASRTHVRTNGGGDRGRSPKRPGGLSDRLSGCPTSALTSANTAGRSAPDRTATVRLLINPAAAGVPRSDHGGRITPDDPPRAGYPR